MESFVDKYMSGENAGAMEPWLSCDLRRTRRHFVWAECVIWDQRCKTKKEAQATIAHEIRNARLEVSLALSTLLVKNPCFSPIKMNVSELLAFQVCGVLCWVLCLSCRGCRTVAIGDKDRNLKIKRTEKA